MNKRVPDILSRVVGLADTMIREQDELGTLRQSDVRAVELDQLFSELHLMVDDARGHSDRLPDDTALMLVQCLQNLNVLCGPLGNSEASTKWCALAKLFKPWVATDLVRARVEVGKIRPATSDQDYMPAPHR